MYAIVEIAGQQFKVSEGDKVFVHRLEANEGEQLSFERVLLVENGGSIHVGTPTVSGMAVNATVLAHVQGDKVIVFKKKRRKGYRKKNGHRQAFTHISIDGIGAATGAAPRAKVQADDLTKIEGIGPKINDIFQAAGLRTFADLAQASEEHLMELLKSAGPQFASKKPGTWPRQAQMAAEGRWDELKAWQDEMLGGIE